MRMTSFYVYKITNKQNNKIYIGKTNNIKIRWTHHKYNAITKGESSYFYNAIRKYGEDNFLIEIIENCVDEDVALAQEIYWIATLKSNDRDIGYNLTNGGDGVSGLIHNEESKQKQREKMIGRKLSEEHKKKISEGNLGKIISDEVKNKISQANSGSNNGMFGKSPTLETRNKLSEFQSSRPHSLLTEEHKQKNRLAAQNQDHSFRIPLEIKDEIVKLYSSGKYTKQQLSDKFGLKYNSVVKIIRMHNKRENYAKSSQPN